MQPDAKFDQLFAAALAAHEEVLGARAAVEEARETQSTTATRQFTIMLDASEATLRQAKQAIVDHFRKRGGSIHSR